MVLPATALAAGGAYQLLVSGDGATAYEVDLLLNAAVEQEDNGTPGECPGSVGQLFVAGRHRGARGGGRHGRGRGLLRAAVDCRASRSRWLWPAAARRWNCAIRPTACWQPARLPTNADQVINDFVATAAGTYYARVVGTGAEYTLVMTRNADFDTESNDALDAAQPLNGVGTVLGRLNGPPPGTACAGPRTGSPAGGGGSHGGLSDGRAGIVAARGYDQSRHRPLRRRPVRRRGRAMGRGPGRQAGHAAAFGLQRGGRRAVGTVVRLRPRRRPAWSALPNVVYAAPDSRCRCW